ncbi:MAG: TIGR03905 family TSCPD domain-containing protein [Bacteroidales bacterium]|nr:TIGR03905 family TSCPD domain-containing protein [Bacteroidales bacterium]
MFDVRKIFDRTEGDVRRTAFETCGQVCSRQIDIETDGEVIRQVRYTGGCNGNTQGVAALVAGMKIDEAIARLEGIDCNGRGTSCPDQLARALKQL